MGPRSVVDLDGDQPWTLAPIVQGTPRRITHSARLAAGLLQQHRPRGDIAPEVQNAGADRQLSRSKEKAPAGGLGGLWGWGF
jgi:hypothetical protein